MLTAPEVARLLGLKPRTVFGGFAHSISMPSLAASARVSTMPDLDAQRAAIRAAVVLLRRHGFTVNREGAP